MTYLNRSPRASLTKTSYAPQMGKDYYKTLGVDRSADDDAIKKAGPIQPLYPFVR